MITEGKKGGRDAEKIWTENVRNESRERRKEGRNGRKY